MEQGCSVSHPEIQSQIIIVVTNLCLRGSRTNGGVQSEWTMEQGCSMSHPEIQSQIIIVVYHFYY